MTQQNQQSYLRIGRATELADKKNRITYRILEIIPGLMAWGTFIVLIAGSWLAPGLTAIFLIAFVSFWFLRTIYFSVLLYLGYQHTKQSMAINWGNRLQSVSLPGPKLENLTSLDSLWHIVVIPTAHEPYPVLAQTLNAILETNYDKKRIIVVVGCEERFPDSTAEKLELITKNFSESFGKLLITIHPDNLPGEIRGKSSNQSFALRQALNQLINPMKIPYEHMIVSVLDSDTRVSLEYFNCLAFHYLTCPKPLRSSFQPIPVYMNNIWEAPVLSRILAFSTTFWQMIQQARPENLVTYSSQAIGLRPLVDIGMWQENVVSEDSRIFYQCHLNFDGDWNVIPLAVTVSMDANVAPTLRETMVNIYKQQRRWAYGAENIPYLLYGYINNPRIPFIKKIRHAASMIEGFHSWNTHSIILLVVGWLPLWFGPKSFSFTLISYNLPQIAGVFMRMAMIGIIMTGYLSIALMPQKNKKLSRKDKIGLLLQWMIAPISILLSTIPAIDASTRLMLGKYMGFWVTPKNKIAANETPEQNR